MVTLDTERNLRLSATDYWARCSVCGWANSVPVLTITDLAAADGMTECLTGAVSAALVRARNHHRCLEQSS